MCRKTISLFSKVTALDVYPPVVCMQGYLTFYNVWVGIPRIS